MAENSAESNQARDKTAEAAAGAPRPDSVASPEDNRALEHTAGGVTTRDDALDAGVPMLPGDPLEPIGPEDAMGPGPKRGDYSGRLNAGPHLVSERIPDSEREVVELKDDEGNVIGREVGPHTRLVDAGARAEERGDEPGKGGVPGSTVRDSAETSGGTRTA